MSLEATIKCDGDGCWHEIDIDDPYSFSIEQELGEDWHQDPDDYEAHYCPKCWEKVKEELGGSDD